LGLKLTYPKISSRSSLIPAQFVYGGIGNGKGPFPSPDNIRVPAHCIYEGTAMRLWFGQCQFKATETPEILETYTVTSLIVLKLGSLKHPNGTK
jgi:hypothetical protein